MTDYKLTITPADGTEQLIKDYDILIDGEFKFSTIETVINGILEHVGQLSAGDHVLTVVANVKSGMTLVTNSHPSEEENFEVEGPTLIAPTISYNSETYDLTITNTGEVVPDGYYIYINSAKEQTSINYGGAGTVYNIYDIPSKKRGEIMVEVSAYKDQTESAKSNVVTITELLPLPLQLTANGSVVIITNPNDDTYSPMADWQANGHSLYGVSVQNGSFDLDNCGLVAGTSYAICDNTSWYDQSLQSRIIPSNTIYVAPDTAVDSWADMDLSSQIFANMKSNIGAGISALDEYDGWNIGATRTATVSKFTDREGHDHATGTNDEQEVDLVISSYDIDSYSLERDAIAQIDFKTAVNGEVRIDSTTMDDHSGAYKSYFGTEMYITTLPLLINALSIKNYLIGFKISEDIVEENYQKLHLRSKLEVVGDGATINPIPYYLTADNRRKYSDKEQTTLASWWSRDFDQNNLINGKWDRIDKQGDYKEGSQGGSMNVAGTWLAPFGCI